MSTLNVQITDYDVSFVISRTGIIRKCRCIFYSSILLASQMSYVKSACAEGTLVNSMPFMYVIVTFIVM